MLCSLFSLISWPYPPDAAASAAARSIRNKFALNPMLETTAWVELQRRARITGMSLLLLFDMHCITRVFHHSRLNEYTGASDKRYAKAVPSILSPSRLESIKVHCVGENINAINVGELFTERDADSVKRSVAEPALACDPELVYLKLKKNVFVYACHISHFHAEI
ncbi:hypothetical protein HZH68_016162 [Vespula germanica]|uniref:Uncharacterized protein n=1 Tax=Vespula germanica TaxID=30212 RepID=A0A834MQ89_VESGE|nr:hypothetical protein HZH68_016162 [Vespula germanica]